MSYNDHLVRKKRRYIPATLMETALVFRLAMKLATFKKKARNPLNPRAKYRVTLPFVSINWAAFENSPVATDRKIVWKREKDDK